MAVPKKKTSKSKSRSRRAHLHPNVMQTTPCPHCGNFKLPHRVCPSCGYYKDTPVTNPEGE